MSQNAQIIRGLDVLLSDYQVLYHKLRTYHWNVTGPMFFALHAKFEELYNDAALKVDELAERLIALGSRPTRTLAAQLGQARLVEDDESPDANQMVGNLAADLSNLTTFVRELASSASDAGDNASMNLLEGIADEQEKTTWMLRAYLAD